MIPSNSLAAIYGIAADCAERQVLGPDVGIDIEAIDESNTRVDVPALIARLRRNGNFGLLALVGVQSNQYPRALDIAREFRRAGVAVAIGGFHVSGCLAMLDGRAVELDACRDLGISIFAGEAEGRLEAVLQDAVADGGAEDLPIVEGRREFRAGIPDAWTEDQLMRFLALNQWPSWELPARAGGSPDLFSFSATRGDRVPAKT